MLGLGVFLLLMGLVHASIGVRGIVTKELELTDEFGGTTTLRGLSAVLVSSVFALFGIGMLLLIPVIAVGA